uniref:Uncharacterized protein n=1 Tax=Kalanchoe fedtschenkoi TaxID=63787 RepID=A0A7N0UYW1_KALFE
MEHVGGEENLAEKGSECGGKDPFRMEDSTPTCGAEWPFFAPMAPHTPACNTIASHPQTANHTSSVVEELTVNNCGISDTAAALTDQGLQSKKCHWQHLYKLTAKSRSQHGQTVSADQGHIVLSARDQLKRMSSDNQNSNLLSSLRFSRDPEEVSAQLMNGYNKIMSNSSSPDQALTPKTLASPHLAQLFAMKVNKGKGVIDSDQYLHTKSTIASGMECQNVNLTSDIKNLSNEQSVMNECSPLKIESSAPRVSNKHVILRNWLKPGCYKLNNIESLDIFRKILELVDDAHSQGFILHKLRPSYLILEFPNKVKYIGPLMQNTDIALNKSDPKKRLFADDLSAYPHSSAKKQEFKAEPISFQSRCRHDFTNKSENELSSDVSHFCRIRNQNISGGQTKSSLTKPLSSVSSSTEEQWYSSPEELNGMECTFSSNTYALGVLFFELLSCSKTPELHSAAMLNLRNRVLPPTLLSEHPKEVGFCLWLLHPDAALRPSVREILESDVFCQPYKKAAVLPVEDNLPPYTEVEDNESELLLHFLMTLKEQKHSQASKLRKDLDFLNADIQDIERRNVQRSSLKFPEKGSFTDQNILPGLLSRPLTISKNKHFVKDKQLEDAYFSIRSRMQRTEPVYERPDKDVLKSTGKWLQQRSKCEGPHMNKSFNDEVGVFFDGLCKYAAYNKIEERGTLRSGDLLSSANVVCSLGFDRDEDFIATAWVSKKIKIFGFDALLDDSIDIHYPIAEMTNKSMLSCICWNSYIKNYLASTDYDGTVQIWDANTSQALSQYSEHQKRAWSVDFSKVDPKKFATGSDDYLVKIWNINERNSTITIRNPANICCVQFSHSSTNLVAFGSADYKLYCYDLRHTRIPWCTLADHERTVSHLKFLDSETIVSASTDNTLKLWDLKKTSPAGVPSSTACSLTYKGHTNQKNFVGLSVLDGYIACGSETNEVFAYHKSLPMAITSYKFSSVDPISGHKKSDDHSQFVSSVCWRRKSNMILAANSTGNIKLLQMARETI